MVIRHCLPGLAKGAHREAREGIKDLLVNTAEDPITQLASAMMCMDIRRITKGSVDRVDRRKPVLLQNGCFSFFCFFSFQHLELSPRGGVEGIRHSSSSSRVGLRVTA